MSRHMHGNIWMSTFLSHGIQRQWYECLGLPCLEPPDPWGAHNSPASHLDFPGGNPQSLGRVIIGLVPGYLDLSHAQ